MFLMKEKSHCYIGHGNPEVIHNYFAEVGSGTMIVNVNRTPNVVPLMRITGTDYFVQ